MENAENIVDVVSFDEDEMNKGFEDMFDRMVEKQGEFDGKQYDEDGTRASAESVLERLNEHIKSKEFTKMVKFQSRKTGVNKRIIKNVYAANMLDRVGTTFGLTIEITGNAMKLLVNFIGYLLSNIVNIAVGVLVRIVNVLTFKTVPLV